jgi:hypothetical protein
VVDAANPVDLVFGLDDQLYYAALGSGEVRRFSAITDQPITGHKLTLKGAAIDPARRSLAAQSKDATITLPPACDTATAVGATLRVTSASFDDTYTLPPGYWTAAHGRYTYKDKTLSASPVRAVTLRAGRQLKISARGALGHALLTDPNPVSVVLQMVDTRYCMSFGGVTKYSFDRYYYAKGAAAPAACPP